MSLEESVLSERVLKCSLFPSQTRVPALPTEQIVSGECRRPGWRDEGSVLGIGAEEVSDQR